MVGNARRIRSILAIVATLGVSLLFFTNAAYASSSGGIGGRPANPIPDNPRSQSIFIYTIDVNQAKNDQVLISNNSDQTRTISFYSVDGVATNTGAYTCKQKSEASTDAGGWVNLAKNQITLSPGSSEKVNFTVKVPSNASVGEHSACIVFQDDKDEGQETGNIRLRTRQAIRMAVTVPGELERKITISSFSVANNNQIQQYSLSLQNSGNVSADVNTSVKLKNIFGGTEYQGGGQYPVMRDQKLDLVFDNTEMPFWGGWYTAQAEATYDKRAGSFGVSDAKNDLITIQSQQIIVFIMPSLWAMLIYILIIVIVVGILIYLYMRKHLAKRRSQTWQKYTVVSGDTIQSIADSVGMEWKKLAKVNKLKAPYILTINQIVLIPELNNKKK